MTQTVHVYDSYTALKHTLGQENLIVPTAKKLNWKMLQLVILKKFAN